MFSSDLNASSHRAAQALWQSRKGGIEEAAQRMKRRNKNKGQKREQRGA